MNDLIFYKMHNPTGMINQLMSFELAIGLAYETKRTVVIHNMVCGDFEEFGKRLAIYTPLRHSEFKRDVPLLNNDNSPHIKDLIDWDKSLNIVLIDENIEKFPQEDFVYEDIQYCYYSNNESTYIENIFSEGRERLNFIKEKNFHLKNTLGWYSRFFFNRSSGLDKALSSVKFKKEYLNFAEMVAKSIGDFNGVHIRLTDHAIRMFDTKEEMILNGLNSFDDELPIVICTDDPNNIIFNKINKNIIIIDDYIFKNFKKEFLSLPFTDEIVLGLVSNLIMHYSKDFIGTSGSTYTAYIHRNINQKTNNMKWKFFDNPNTNNNGPFSWVNYSLPLNAKMWWREWDESKINV